MRLNLTSISDFFQKLSKPAESKSGANEPLAGTADQKQGFCDKIIACKNKEDFIPLYDQALADPQMLDVVLSEWKNFSAGLRKNPADFWRETLVALAEKSDKPVDAIRETIAKLPEALRQTVLDECLLTSSFSSNSGKKMATYVGWFLEAGGKADVNNSAALIHAAAQRDEDLVRLLVSKGAKFNDALRQDRKTDYSLATQNLMFYQEKMTGKAWAPETDPALLQTIDQLRQQMTEMTGKMTSLETEIKMLKSHNPAGPANPGA